MFLLSGKRPSNPKSLHFFSLIEVVVRAMASETFVLINMLLEPSIEKFIVIDCFLVAVYIFLESIEWLHEAAF